MGPKSHKQSRSTAGKIEGESIIASNHQPFQKITEASRITGLSAYYLRNGCKNGSIPHTKSGGVYYINVPELLRKLASDTAKDANFRR